MVLYQITRPLSYLQIEHQQKWKFDWLIPLVFAVISTGVLFLLRDYLDIYSSEGLISQVLSFIQILPGFYIAALAAISTFNKNDIDQIMPEPTPKMEILIQGQKNTIDLTRRRFLCMLFAFLVAESIIVALLAIFALNFAGAIKSLLNIHLYIQIGISHFFIFIFSLLFWQLIVSTFLGLYYLGDKMHHPNLD